MSKIDEFTEGWPTTERPLTNREIEAKALAAIAQQRAEARLQHHVPRGMAGSVGHAEAGLIKRQQVSPGGVITNRIQEQLDVLSKRVSTVAGLAGETADRLFGSEPKEPGSTGGTAVPGTPGELGVISGLFDRLARQLDALEHHVRRLTPL